MKSNGAGLERGEFGGAQERRQVIQACQGISEKNNFGQNSRDCTGFPARRSLTLPALGLGEIVHLGLEECKGSFMCASQLAEFHSKTQCLH